MCEVNTRDDTGSSEEGSCLVYLPLPGDVEVETVGCMFYYLLKSSFIHYKLLHYIHYKLLQNDPPGLQKHRIVLFSGYDFSLCDRVPASVDMF